MPEPQMTANSARQFPLSCTTDAHQADLQTDLMFLFVMRTENWQSTKKHFQ
jgi:hypothetical protein